MDPTELREMDNNLRLDTHAVAGAVRDDDRVSALSSEYEGVYERRCHDYQHQASSPLLYSRQTNSAETSYRPRPISDARTPVSSCAVSVFGSEETLKSYNGRRDATAHGQETRSQHDKPKGLWNRCDDFLKHTWVIEIASEAVAVLGLAGIVALLLSFQGKPQTAWQYKHFTLNGLIALLATMVKSALMYPVSEAIGQRKWLWFVPLNAEQRFQRDEEGLELSGMYDEASRGAFGSVKLLSKSRLHDFVSIGAVVTLLSMLFSAMTQNLMATELKNTGVLQADQKAGNVPRIDTLTEYRNQSQLRESCDELGCTHGLPGNATVYVPSVDHMDAASIPVPVIMSAVGDNSIFNDLEVSPSDFPPVIILSLDIIGVPMSDWSPFALNASIANTPPADNEPVSLVAAQCGFWMCVKALETQVMSFAPSEKIVGQWSKAEILSNENASVIPEGTMYRFVDIPHSFNVEENASYTFSEGARLRLQKGMQDVFTGSVVTTFWGAVSISRADLLDVGMALQSVWTTRLGPNITDWVSIVSTCLTNNLRQYGGPSSNTSTHGEKYVGSASREVVVIKKACSFVAQFARPHTGKPGLHEAADEFVQEPLGVMIYFVYSAVDRRH
ncbi:hypothetical protein LTR85_003608 [Meristemomyces frigidus]|nr:hypothetical protein LTR85_003608 [Meristemomyces frigidus]